MAPDQGEPIGLWGSGVLPPPPVDPSEGKTPDPHIGLRSRALYDRYKHRPTFLTPNFFYSAAAVVYHSPKHSVYLDHRLQLRRV